jgi:hypothetical protein
MVKKYTHRIRPFGLGTLLMLGAVATGFGQKLPPPTRVWSVGPLSKSELEMGVVFGARGATFTGEHLDSQTGSVFSATRSVVFAGDRIVLVSRGMRRVEDARVPVEVHQLLSLEAQTGEVKDTREIDAIGSVPLFATSDAHVIVAGLSLMRLTPDLRDAGNFEYRARKVGNISPDGSTLGMSPGFELVDARTLEARELTPGVFFASVETSVSNNGFVTNKTQWIGKYPKDRGFVTYTDTAGDHLVYHGKCGGRPQ